MLCNLYNNQKLNLNNNKFLYSKISLQQKEFDPFRLMLDPIVNLSRCKPFLKFCTKKKRCIDFSVGDDS